MGLLVIGVFRINNTTSGLTINDITDFRLLNTDDYVVEDADFATVMRLLNDGVEIVNLEKNTQGGLRGSQGNLNRYPVIDKATNRPVGRSPLTIIHPLSDKNYRICDYAGQVSDMSEQNLVEYGLLDGLTNAKLVPLVSGNGYEIFPIDKEFLPDPLLKQKGLGGSVKAKLQVFQEKPYELDEKYYAKLINFKLAKLVLPKGVLGIQARGFKRAKELKELILPPTLDYIGAEAFAESGIERIIIPEGITTIPIKCFFNCSSLREVKLPKSLKLIDRMAFTGCKQGAGGLTIIMNRKPERVVYGAIPQGIAIKRESVKIGE